MSTIKRFVANKFAIRGASWVIPNIFEDILSYQFIIGQKIMHNENYKRMVMHKISVKGFAKTSKHSKRVYIYISR